MKFLGSYPVAGQEAHVRRTAAGKAWRDATLGRELRSTELRGRQVRADRIVIDVRRLRDEPEYRARHRAQARARRV